MFRRCCLVASCFYGMNVKLFNDYSKSDPSFDVTMPCQKYLFFYVLIPWVRWRPSGIQMNGAWKFMLGKVPWPMIQAQPGWVGLVLGRDFNSRGMETCRGSISPSWRLRADPSIDKACVSLHLISVILYGAVAQFISKRAPRSRSSFLSGALVETSASRDECCVYTCIYTHRYSPAIGSHRYFGYALVRMYSH